MFFRSGKDFSLYKGTRVTNDSLHKIRTGSSLRFPNLSTKQFVLKMSLLPTLSNVRQRLSQSVAVKDSYQRVSVKVENWAFRLQFSQPVSRSTGQQQSSSSIFVHRWGQIKSTPFSLYLTSGAHWYHDTILLDEQELVLGTSFEDLLYWDETTNAVPTLFQLIKKYDPNSHLLNYFPRADRVGILEYLSFEQRTELALFWCETIGKEIESQGLMLDNRYARKCDMSGAHRLLTRDGYQESTE